jgi:hypothetical protein
VYELTVTYDHIALVCSESARHCMQCALLNNGSDANAACL